MNSWRSIAATRKDERMQPASPDAWRGGSVCKGQTLRARRYATQHGGEWRASGQTANGRSNETIIRASSIGCPSYFDRDEATASTTSRRRPFMPYTENDTSPDSATWGRGHAPDVACRNCDSRRIDRGPRLDVSAKAAPVASRCTPFRDARGEPARSFDWCSTKRDSARSAHALAAVRRRKGRCHRRGCAEASANFRQGRHDGDARGRVLSGSQV